MDTDGKGREREGHGEIAQPAFAWWLNHRGPQLTVKGDWKPLTGTNWH